MTKDQLSEALESNRARLLRLAPEPGLQWLACPHVGDDGEPCDAQLRILGAACPENGPVGDGVELQFCCQAGHATLLAFCNAPDRPFATLGETFDVARLGLTPSKYEALIRRSLKLEARPAWKWALRQITRGFRWFYR